MGTSHCSSTTGPGRALSHPAPRGRRPGVEVAEGRRTVSETWVTFEVAAAMDFGCQGSWVARHRHSLGSVAQFLGRLWVKQKHEVI